MIDLFLQKFGAGPGRRLTINLTGKEIGIALTLALSLVKAWTNFVPIGMTGLNSKLTHSVCVIHGHFSFTYFSNKSFLRT